MQIKERETGKSFMVWLLPAPWGWGVESTTWKPSGEALGSVAGQTEGGQLWGGTLL